MIKTAIQDQHGPVVVYGVYGDDAQRLAEGAITTIDLTPVLALGVRTLRVVLATGTTREEVEQRLERAVGPLPFTCPRCQRTSHHPDDKRYGYCGACHAYTGEPS